jgi:aryl-alcohol dehydrogenase-like predicted oxidoreductase
MADSAWARRRLGRTGLGVTPLGLGGAHLGRTPDGHSDQLAVATVHRALELGLNLIDTSPMYGESERRVGLALDEWYDHERRRADIIISTKTGYRPEGMDYSADWTRRSVQQSLRLLRTDYLDVVLVHDPRDLSPVLEPGGALEALEEFREQGVTRAIGLGVRNHEFHRRCIESGDFDVCLTYCDYNLLDQSAAEGVLTPAAAHDVGVLNGAAVMLGLLGGGDPREVAPSLGAFAAPERVERACRLWDWAEARGVSLLALNLQFCTREKRIASTLVGAANPAEIEADVAAASEYIPEAFWLELDELLGG